MILQREESLREQFHRQKNVCYKQLPLLYETFSQQAARYATFEASCGAEQVVNYRQMLDKVTADSVKSIVPRVYFARILLDQNK